MQSTRYRRLPSAWFLVGLIVAGLMALQFYVQWLSSRSVEWTRKFSEQYGIHVALELLALVLATLAAIVVRHFFSARFASPVAMLVGAVATAPLNSAYGMALGLLGAGLAARLTSGNAQPIQNVLARIRQPLKRESLSKLHALALLWFLYLAWLIVSGQLEQWAEYYAASGLARTAGSVKETVAKSAPAWIFLLGLMLAWRFGRTIAAVGLVDLFLGFICARITFLFPPAAQIPVGGSLLVVLLVAQAMMLPSAVRLPPPSHLRTRSNGARQVMPVMTLFLVSSLALWMGPQLDTIRRMTDLTRHNWGSSDAVRAESRQWLLGPSRVHKVATDDMDAIVIRVLSGFPFLEELDINGRLAPDCSLANLTRQLTTFDTVSLTVQQCRELSQLPHLHDISLYDDVSDEKLAYLSIAPLEKFHAEGGMLSTHAMKHFRSKNLRSLHLYGVSLTDEHLAHLPVLPALSELHLFGNRLHGHSLDRLAIHPQLASLYLDSNPIEEPTLPKLQRLPALGSLSLRGVALCDAKQSQLGRLRVHTLDLYGTAITDDWAEDFLQQLKARAVTPWQLNALRVDRSYLSEESRSSLRPAANLFIEY